MTPRSIAQLVGATVAGLALAALFLTVKGWRDDAARYKGLYDGLAAEAQAAGQVGGALSGALDAGGYHERDVASRRAEADRMFEELKRHDPTVDDWASQPIPSRLRDDERARRLSLDGPAAGEDRGEAPDREAPRPGHRPAP